MIPRATYRLQLHRDFTFADATRLVPYLAKLGISHVYSSPILAARPGSMHGYDVIDPTRVNPELGGEDGLVGLVAALRQAGLGLIVDTVPNHMYAGAGNEWWLDVLRRGRASAYAGYFDIDWSALGGKILLPILGKPYGAVLADGDLVLDRAGSVIRYFDNAIPVDQASVQGDAATQEQLHALLERQHYRLAWWRTAADEINWRRFFDINELVAVRVEDQAVFEATHATLFRLYAEGLVDGVRIDHIDGLADPAGYCRALRARLTALRTKRPPSAEPGPAYFVVEKILGRDEQLPSLWQTDGTVGYDFMNQVNAVQHDPAGAAPLTALWTEIAGRTGDFATEEEQARREILARSFTAPLEALVRSFAAIAQGDVATRDITAGALRRCLVEVMAQFEVYRTYPGDTDNNAEFLDRALAAARRRVFPGDRDVLDRFGEWLRAPSRAQIPFEQLTAPLAAKAVEDTAFYRYGRSLSRNDVGFDAAHLAMAPGEFHQTVRARHESFPHALLATATHDHKRGEDVRARLAVLSEIPGEWAATLRAAMAANASLRGRVNNAAAPSPGDEAMLYQTIVGAWPTTLAADDAAGLKAYAERLAQWFTKAMREAKLATDWAAPNEAYEKPAQEFLARLFAERGESLHILARFAHRIAAAGAANGLAQTVLKLTSPGVPDLFQGTEFWDQSLVDPDNRRPVDYAARIAALDRAVAPDRAIDDWRDGHVKQAVIARILACRQARPTLFADGDYVPLVASGPAADHVIAFARIRDVALAIVVVARLPIQLLDGADSLRIPAERWRRTELALPDGLAGRPLANILGDGTMTLGARVAVADLLCDLPVAMWAGQAALA
jgi:(1->4)-alpha-D-glucan 1-alpha-D-glucosylmutase